jgi:hypothetical protein
MLLSNSKNLLPSRPKRGRDAERKGSGVSKTVEDEKKDKWIQGIIDSESNAIKKLLENLWEERVNGQDDVVEAYRICL